MHAFYGNYEQIDQYKFIKYEKLILITDYIMAFSVAITTKCEFLGAVI